MEDDPDAHLKGLALWQLRYDTRLKNLLFYQHLEGLIRSQHRDLGSEVVLDPEYWGVRRKLRHWERQMDLGFHGDVVRPMSDEEVVARTLEQIGRLTEHQRSPE